MLEQVKQVLIEKYDSKIAEYESLKNQVMTLEDKIEADNAEETYKEDLKNLKKAKLKKNSEEYNSKLKEIELKYEQSLIDFKKIYDEYVDLKNAMAKIDIYGFQRKKIRVEGAEDLKDLKLDDEKAAKIINGEMDDIM
mgnify:FL=1